MKDIDFTRKDFYKSSALFVFLMIIYLMAHYKFQLEFFSVLHDAFLFGVILGLFKLLRKSKDDQQNYLFPNIFFI